MDVWLIVTIAGAVPLFGYSICQWYFIFRDHSKTKKEKQHRIPRFTHEECYDRTSTADSRVSGSSDSHPNLEYTTVAHA